jgi:hypothetical protein
MKCSSIINRKKSIISGFSPKSKFIFENQDFVREIFISEDSDEEFLGYDEDDLENDEQIAAFEDNWICGNLDTRVFAFDAEKK